MTGLNVKRLIWTIVFLGTTLAAIVMEVVAAVWHPAGTIPWTEYLATYVPWPIQLIAYVALAVWLPFHFWRHDHLRKIAYRNGKADAAQEYALDRERVREEAHDAGYLKALQDHKIPIPTGADLLPEVSVRRGGLQYKRSVLPPSEELLLPHEKI